MDILPKKNYEVNDMKFGDRLKTLRLENRYTQEILAKKSGVSRKSIVNYESNKTSPTYYNVQLLAQAFGMSPATLLYPVTEERIQGLYKKAIAEKVEKEYTTPALYTVNVYGNVPAGTPLEATENIKRQIYLNSRKFPLNKKFIALEVEGNSMYPRFLEGDTVIVELTHDFKSGDIVVAYVNGYKSTLKKIIKNNDGSVTLKPYNPEYPEHTYGVGHEQGPISILGVVRELRRDI